MHTFPQLRKIEKKYGDRVIVVGVHSPKFPAERETANLREAVLRYRIEHPVVNDRDFAVWQRFGGRAWPTLMFIDPEGRVIGKHEGELPFEQFDPLVAGMLKEFEERGLLHAPASTIALEEIREPARTLSFPGKVLATKDGLFIADSNHHRIVFTGFDGSIRRTYGSGEPGFADGPAERAAFQQPQGMARSGWTLYVADTENHAIPSIDLESRLVTTLDGPLYVADAEVSAVRDIDLHTARVTTLVGEDLFVFGDQDGEGDAVRLQHPLGITGHDGSLCVADSYNNKIKRLDPGRRAATSWLGSGAAGRADGVGPSATFREPGGVCAGVEGLYIADTNNHRIAVADWTSGTVRTVIGD